MAFSHDRHQTNRPGLRWLVAIVAAGSIGAGLWLLPAEMHHSLIARTGLALPPPLTPQIAIACSGAFIGLVFALALGALSGGRKDTQVDEWDADMPGPDPDGAGASIGEEQLGNDLSAEPEERRKRIFNPREDLGEEGIATAHAGRHSVTSGVAFPDEELIEESDGMDINPNVPPFREPGTPHIEVDALADLSLSELTSRLERAMRGPYANRPAVGRAPSSALQSASDLPEAQLRSALEKLSRTTGQG